MGYQRTIGYIEWGSMNNHSIAIFHGIYTGIDPMGLSQAFGGTETCGISPEAMAQCLIFRSYLTNFQRFTTLDMPIPGRHVNSWFNQGLIPMIFVITISYNQLFMTNIWLLYVVIINFSYPGWLGCSNFIPMI